MGSYWRGGSGHYHKFDSNSFIADLRRREKSRGQSLFQWNRDVTSRDGLPPGSYFATALDYLQQGESDDPEFLERLTERATRVDVSESNIKTIDLRLTTERPY